MKAWMKRKKMTIMEVKIKIQDQDLKKMMILM